MNGFINQRSVGAYVDILGRKNILDGVRQRRIKKQTLVEVERTCAFHAETADDDDDVREILG